MWWWSLLNTRDERWGPKWKEKKESVATWLGGECRYVEKHFMSCAEALRRCSRRPRCLKQDTASGWWRGTVRCCWSGMRVSSGHEPSRCCGRQPAIEHCCCPIVKLHFNSFSIIITICFPYKVGLGAALCGRAIFLFIFFCCFFRVG